MMGTEGLEPSRPKTADFKLAAPADYATCPCACPQEHKPRAEHEPQTRTIELSWSSSRRGFLASSARIAVSNSCGEGSPQHAQVASREIASATSNSFIMSSPTRRVAPTVGGCTGYDKGSSRRRPRRPVR